jgi:hypothetical protein
MSLNPAFDQQTSRPLPFMLGWVYGQGDQILTNVDAEGETVQFYILGSGEWWGNWALSLGSGTRYFGNSGQLVGGIPAVRQIAKIHTVSNNPIFYYYHFHSGAFGTKGLPNNLISLGPDQGTDFFQQSLPSVTPALTYSGMAYYVVRATIGGIVGDVPDLTPLGVWMATRCRIFDANGNVTGYAFTVNPTWQMIETLLRFQIKPQQPGLAGLSAAEKACFDWPAMVAHAQRNATILPNGKPRFSGSWCFAADTTVAQMMEMQLRNCLSFRRVRGGKLSFVGEEQRASVFTFSQRNMFPGSLKLNKKDLSNAPNIYVPQYRDLEIPAVCAVASAITTPPTSNTATVTTFTTIGQQPFFSNDYMTYGGGSNDVQFAGEYQVGLYTATPGGSNTAVTIAPPIPNQFVARGGPGGPSDGALQATGGYVGTQQSRFSKRAPNVVQHRAHQRAVGQVAPGIPPIPKSISVSYDMGNNTFDQTNRVMKTLMARDLGTDGPNWIAPLKGTISGFLEAVDVSGSALIEVEPGDVITLDDTAAPDFPGLYEVVDPLTTYAPSAQDGSASKRDLTIQTYNPDAFTDVSDDPGLSFQSVPNNYLPMDDILPATPAWWLVQATPQASFDSSSTGSIIVPDVTIWWQGDTLATVYPLIEETGVPIGQKVTLYLVVTDKATTPTLRLDTTNAEPPQPLPAGNVILFYGTFTNVQAFNGPTVNSSAIPAGSSQELPVAAGASQGMVFTPSNTYLDTSNATGTTLSTS